MKKTLLTLLLFGCFSVASAQGFAYYPFNSIFSVSSNPTSKVWVDARFQTNSYFSSLSTEFSPMLNVNTNPKGRFYVGVAARFNFLLLVEDYRLNPLEGYALNVGVRSEPFEKMKNFQLAFELSPFVQRDFKVGLIRSYLGIAYYFDKKK